MNISEEKIAKNEVFLVNKGQPLNYFIVVMKGKMTYMDKSYSNGVVFDNFFIKEEEFILEDNLVVDKDTHYTIIDMHIYKTIIKDKIEILIQSKIENDNNVM